MRSWSGVKVVAADAVAVGIALLLLTRGAGPSGFWYENELLKLEGSAGGKCR
jgi:hypothetical protein